jgi:uncharacterized SAM-binding protein YcdF (DUF218 family)
MLYRVVNELSEPFALVLLFVLGAALVSWRRAKRGGGWLVLGVLGLVALCHPLTAWLALRSLESQHPPAPVPPDVQAIVVLSGWMRATPDGEGHLAEDSTIRTVCAADLYRRLGRRPIVATGGLVSTAPEAGPLSEKMRTLLRQLGVRPQDIVVETASRTTAENASLTASLLSRRGIRRIALVTDGAHLPRSVLAFRKQGLDVVPAGCSYTALRRPPIWSSLVPSAAAAGGVQRAVHEWMGIAWYRLRGFV